MPPYGSILTLRTEASSETGLGSGGDGPIAANTGLGNPRSSSLLPRAARSWTPMEMRSRIAAHDP